MPDIPAKACFYRTSAGTEVDLILKFRTGESWAIEIKRGLSTVLTSGFYWARNTLLTNALVLASPKTKPTPLRILW